jgi:hypothetical protein
MWDLFRFNRPFLRRPSRKCLLGVVVSLYLGYEI